MARSSRKAAKVWTPAASRCQSGPERRNMPSGMLSLQNPIGRPTTVVSIPSSSAFAATAIPYGPAPTTSSDVWSTSPSQSCRRQDLTVRVMRPAEPASVIVAAARTPVGRFGGVFRNTPAVELGAVALRAAVQRASAAAGAGDPERLAAQIDYVLMGHVIQAGLGQN